MTTVQPSLLQTVAWRRRERVAEHVDLALVEREQELTWLLLQGIDAANAA